MNQDISIDGQYILEILKKKSEVGILFEKGGYIAFSDSPISIKYLKQNNNVSDANKFLFSVSKKTIPKAVLRNKVRRRLKEACTFLLQQNILTINNLFVAIIYKHKDILNYHVLLSYLNKLFDKLNNIA